MNQSRVAQFEVMLLFARVSLIFIMLLAELKPKGDSLEREREKLFFQINRLNEDFSQYSRSQDNRSRVFEHELSQLRAEKISHQKKLKARILEILQVADNERKIKANAHKYSYE